MDNKTQIQNNFNNQIDDAKSSWKIEIVNNTISEPKEDKKKK